MELKTLRKPDHPIDPLFFERWSPRAFTDEAIPDEVLASCFEAARWAPSSMNAQPWRFIYSKRGSASWPTLLGLLNDFNRSWAQHAAALMVVAAKQTVTYNGQELPSPTHAFDAGAAWMQFALEATTLGWHTHGMVGLDRDKARVELAIPGGYSIIAAIAVGRMGDKALLPPALQDREVVSTRVPISQFAFEGRFSGS
jgi:nitroreductase